MVQFVFDSPCVLFQVHVADDLDGFGFANQDPWIQHMTIRENILFGQPFYHKKYTDVIHCCALEEVSLQYHVLFKMTDYPYCSSLTKFR